MNLFCAGLSWGGSRSLRGRKESGENKWENVNSSVEFNNLFFSLHRVSHRNLFAIILVHVNVLLLCVLYSTLSFCSLWLRFSFITSSGFLLASTRAYSILLQLSAKKNLKSKVIMKEKYRAMKLVSFPEHRAGLLSALSLNARSRETLLSTSFDTRAKKKTKEVRD